MVLSYNEIPRVFVAAFFLLVAEKLSKRHCEERFLRRGNLEVIYFL
jgi:hypothetical protein